MRHNRDADTNSPSSSTIEVRPNLLRGPAEARNDGDETFLERHLDPIEYQNIHEEESWHGSDSLDPLERHTMDRK